MTYLKGWGSAMLSLVSREQSTRACRINGRVINGRVISPWKF